MTIVHSYILRAFCCLLAIGSLFALSVPQLQAQNPSVPTPGGNDEGCTVLMGGVAHLGDGTVIENSIIVFEGEKLTLVANAAVAKGGWESCTKLDITGKHVYPGFIAMNTHMGLAEVGAVRATKDNSEVGDMNPHIRSIIAYNTDSRVTPTVRSNGVLMAQVVPQGGGMLSGRSSVVQLDAWNYEDAVYQADGGLHVNWPRMLNYRGAWGGGGVEKKGEKYLKNLDKLRSFFAEARAYCAKENTKGQKENLKFKAMCDLFNGKQKLFVKANYIKEIIDAVHFAKAEKVEMVLVGGNDCHMALDILKENNISVVLNKTHNLPRRAGEDIDLPFKLPAMLQEAGIDCAITVGDGWDGFWDQRNLCFEAGTAAAYGMSKEEALMTITANPAKMLGIAETTGTLAEGKDATLIISTGDVLDMRSSHIEYAFIQGRPVDMDNKQKALYRKFMEKYGKEIKQH